MIFTRHTRSGFSRAALTWLGAALTLAMVSAPARAQYDSLETVVKATFLHRFASFTEWPDGYFDQPGQPLVLCIAGYDPFGQVLDEAVDGELAAGRLIDLRRFDRVERGTGCHVIFVSAGPGQTVARGLELLQGEPVLTVTDDAISSARGMIHFEIAENRVRFHIDEAQASREGLAISSRLLGLALTVRRREAANG